jgi:hypothetical protein
LNAVAFKIGDYQQCADPVAAFRLRCEVRAILFEEGEMDLHEAVDVLQTDAVAGGLVEAIGQDRVQAIMAAAFGAVERPQFVPIFWPLAFVEAWTLSLPVPLPQQVREAMRRSTHAPQVTLEALMIEFQRCGLAAFDAPVNKERLSRLSAGQRDELRGRMKKSVTRDE